MLKNIFDESQRLTAADLRVVTSYSGLGPSAPTFLGDAWQLTVSILPASARTDLDPKRLRTDLPVSAATDVTVLPTSQVSRDVIADFARMMEKGASEVTTFGDFAGDLGNFANGRTWNDSVITLHMLAPERGHDLLSWATKELKISEEEMRPDEFRVYPGDGYPLEDIPARQLDFVVLKAEVFAGTRKVGETQGQLRCALGGRHARQNDVFVDLPPIRVPTNLFPTGDAYTVSTARPWIEWAAITFAALLSIGLLLSFGMVVFRGGKGDIRHSFSGDGAESGTRRKLAGANSTIGDPNS